MKALCRRSQTDSPLFLPYRMQWEDDFRAYLLSLDAQKPVILCGDLNVAHNEIDIKNAKANIGNAGFSYEERGKFTELLQAGSSMHSAPCIPTRPARTRGGATCSTPAPTTPAGG